MQSLLCKAASRLTGYALLHLAHELDVLAFDHFGGVSIPQRPPQILDELIHVGRIVPLAQSTEAQLEALSQIGLVAWSGERLPPLVPVARATGDRTVADLLLEDRE